MKKRYLFIASAALVLVGCGETTSNGGGIQLGVSVTPEVAAEALRAAMQNTEWAGVSLTSNLGYTFEMNTSVTGDGVTSGIAQKTTVANVADFKASINQTELKKETPDYSKVFTVRGTDQLTQNIEIKVSEGSMSMQQNTDVSVKMGIAYGQASIKPAADSSSISSDWLLFTQEMTGSNSITGINSVETVSQKYGTMGDGLAASVMNSAGGIIGSTSPTSGSTSEAPISFDIPTTSMDIMSLVSSFASFSMNGNSVVAVIDLASVAPVLTAGQLSGLGLVPEDVTGTLTGSLTAEIGITADAKINSLSIELQNASIALASEIFTTGGNTFEGSIALTGGLEITEHTAAVSAPTQAEVDAFGYDNITYSPFTSTGV